VVVDAAQGFADPKRLEEEYERASRQLKFDKIYLEVYRNRQFADDATIAAVKKFFAEKGVEVSGGVTLDTVRAYADAGADLISTSVITQSAPALDLAFDLRDDPGPKEG